MVSKSKKSKEKQKNLMQTFDDEQYIWDIYKHIPSSRVKYIGNFLSCLRVDLLTKCHIFAKSWKNSSSKSDLPPDFHNNLHQIMMEFMRIDDCVNELDGRKIMNSFQRTSVEVKKALGKNYKKKNGVLFYVPDTSNNNEFNIRGYLENFTRNIENHSNKIPYYKKNYPKCKKTILFVMDESNPYIQTIKSENLGENHISEGRTFMIHNCYYDKRFIDVIKNSNADYVIWFGIYKCILINGKPIQFPQAVIYDVKHFNICGYEYNYDSMVKLME